MAYSLNIKTRRRGVAILELAIILPLVLLLTLGIAEYAWLFLKSQETTNAARAGARVAVRADATIAETQAHVDALMSQAGLGDTGYTVTVTPNDWSEMLPGDSITVTVELPYRGNVELLNFPLLPVPQTLRSATTMAREGP